MNVFDLLDEDIVNAIKEQGITKPTEIQVKCIPEIINGKDEHILVIAPTGIGKTEAVILPVFTLIKRNKNPKISVLYITPLRALNRDMLKRTIELGKKINVSISVRHGDTKTSERRQQTIKPPDMLITTPETVQILLISPKFREHLRNIKWVIVDEIHDIVTNERGAQLAVALERLNELAGNFRRIGLSATVGSIEEVGNFLAGSNAHAKVIRTYTGKDMDIDVMIPEPVEIPEPVRKQSIGSEIYYALSNARNRILSHNSTLLFVNTRDTAELLSSMFRLVYDDLDLGIHHGSLSKEVRIETEDKFKRNEIKCLICTSSLELGIDIGHVDYAIQFNSSRDTTHLIQRMGRSSHKIESISHGAIICTSEDEVLEACVIANRVKYGKLEKIKIRENPLTVLANQIIGMTMNEKMDLWYMYDIIRRAYPFRNLSRETYLDVIAQLRKQRILWVNNTECRRTKNGLKYFYDNISMILDEKTYRVIDITSRKMIGKLDESFVMCSDFSEGKFIMRGLSWQLVDIKEDRILVEPSSALGVLPNWSGEEIPVPFEVAQEVGMIRRKKNINDYISHTFTRKKVIEYLRNDGKPIGTDKLITIESTEDKKILIVNLCGGTKVNETIGAILASILSTRIGYPVSKQNDAYRIILKSEIPIYPEWVKQYFYELDENSIEEILNVVLKNTSDTKWMVINTAKKFGAISKDADFSMISHTRIVSTFNNTIIWKDTVDKILNDKMDIENTRKIIKKIRDGEIKIEITNPTNVGLSGLEKRYTVFAGYSISKRMREKLKERLENEKVQLVCLHCFSKRKITVKNIYSLKCNVCGSILIACVNVDEDIDIKKINKNKLMKLKSNANLLLYHGKRAIMILSARGIGVKTATKILQKHYNSEDELLKEILKCEMNYIRTKRYWK